MLLCECLSVLAGHCVVWLSDSRSLKVWLFVSNLFATPGLDSLVAGETLRHLSLRGACSKYQRTLRYTETQEPQRAGLTRSQGCRLHPETLPHPS